MSETTCDAFLGGRVKVVQPKNGFRAGTDSVLISAALDENCKGQVLEIGCGAGGALIPAAFRLTKAAFIGLEQDEDMLSLARKGVEENAYNRRVSIVHGNAGDLPSDWQNRFDLVFSNPPFFTAGSVQAPGEGKAHAYLESVSLRVWLNAMIFASKPKGTIVIIHRAADLARILSVIERQTGEITILPVHSYPGDSAKRVLVRARKGLRPGPIKLLEPKYLYTSKGGGRTDWAYSLQQDACGIDW